MYKNIWYRYKFTSQPTATIIILLSTTIIIFIYPLFTLEQNRESARYSVILPPVCQISRCHKPGHKNILSWMVHDVGQREFPSISLMLHYSLIMLVVHGLYMKSEQDILPHPFQFIIHQSSHISTLYNASNCLHH